MWWLHELEKQSVQLGAERKKNRMDADGARGVVDGNQLRAEDLMTREEMDAWWHAVKEDRDRSMSCPPKGLDLVWTIS